MVDDQKCPTSNWSPRVNVTRKYGQPLTLLKNKSELESFFIEKARQDQAKSVFITLFLAGGFLRFELL